MRFILISPGGLGWQLDTPDPDLVGHWLKGIFDDLTAKDFNSPPYPIEFTLRVS